MSNPTFSSRPENRPSRLGRTARLGILLAACLAVFVWGMSVGLPGVGAGALGELLGLGGAGLEPDKLEQYRAIFWDIRLPRVLLALLAGAGLALSGCGVQAVLGNPLVSPSVLGLSAGASFGAALVIMYGGSLYLALGRPLLIAAAFFMAMLAVLVSYGLAALRRASRETVILAGIAVGYIFSGATVFLQYLAPYQNLRAIVFWSVGSLWNADFSAVAVLVPVVLFGALFLYSQAMPLNTLILGEESSASLGVNVRRLRLSCLLVCTLVCSAIISFTGAIGFVGLLAPHLARSTLGQDNRWLIPGSMLMGALLLTAADSAARALLWPQEIPVGVMTAMIGGPFFLFQLVRRKKDWWG